MSALPSTSHEFIDGMTIGIAVVTRDLRGEPVVSACNDVFLAMMDDARTHPRSFPVPLETSMLDKAGCGLRERLDACFDSGKAQGAEPTYVSLDGARTWRVALEPMVGAHTPTVCMTIIGHAPARQVSRELEASASRFQAVIDSAYDAIVTIDEEHRIRLFNRAAENLFGYRADEVIGQRIEMLLPEKFRGNHARNVRQFANSTQKSLRAVTPPRMDESNSVYGRHRDGTIIPVEIAISKIELEGEVEFTAVVRDISDRARLIQLLKKQAVTDALTGLPNRREFIDSVEKMLAADGVLSVFILDIDYFKKINDSYGHDIGDEVLRVLADVGMTIPFESKLFARWGGEEFVGALPGADASVAFRIADALRKRCEQQESEHVWRTKPIAFTVSIGVVTREAGERDVDALMRRADRALYRAKETGRNRVAVG
ncbi:sensor domain-containing diguanylate cyclase [Paraburkholderia caledonica]|uniref:sensor domain-containing diguanylate cyclase n=1 Tax=Paraburkholderia caledonica TaxID=134536 RepID=UPI000B4906E5|nr:sensor domain-containing diguanylate cyclase [Burkholderia sp. Bk]